MEDNADAPSLMSLYNWMDKIEKFGLVKLNRDKRPHTFKVTQKMKDFLGIKKESTTVEKVPDEEKNIYQKAHEQNQEHEKPTVDWLKDNIFCSVE